MKYRAFVALSGGGAKGVVHVGALKALEEREVQIKGLAGTSAGSIVATLAAAGYTADELIDPEAGTNILGSLKTIDPKLRRAIDLFGGSWGLIKLFRYALGLPRYVLLILSIFLLLLWTTPPIFLLFQWSKLSFHSIVLSTIFWLLLSGIFCCTYLFLIGGLASIKRFRDALSTLLQTKMFPHEPHHIVSMRDFGREGRPALKIVSANLSRSELHLFSPERTPDTPVADAVAASVCLPVIFSPWVIDNELHCDGGIVSNLPAWPFDEERELDPEALTIAVEVAATPTTNKPTRFSWLPAALQTGLFGAGELNLRISGPAEQLALSTEFKLLDFDKTPEEAADEVQAVAALAGLRLDKKLFRLPDIYHNACIVAQALAQDGLQILPGGVGNQPRVRVAVGRLERGYVSSLRLSYSVGFEDDTDEFMLLPISGSVAGYAWEQKQSAFETFPLPPDLDLPGYENRLRRKMRWSGLKWVMCIPILDDKSGEPRLLVQIEGNQTLASNDDTKAALDSVEEAVKEFFAQILSELKELEDDHGA